MSESWDSAASGRDIGESAGQNADEWRSSWAKLPPSGRILRRRLMEECGDLRVALADPHRTTFGQSRGSVGAAVPNNLWFLFG